MWQIEDQKHYLHNFNYFEKKITLYSTKERKKCSNTFQRINIIYAVIELLILQSYTTIVTFNEFYITFYKGMEENPETPRNE